MTTSDLGDRLELEILSLLDARTGTICPSDAARAVGTATTWRSLMDEARAAAGRLADRGEVEITQHGSAVSLDGVRGPIRIRRLRP